MNMISNTALARVNEHSASRAILAVFLCSFLGASCQRNQSLSGEQQKGTGESPSGSEAPPTLVASSARADNEKSSGFQGTKWGMSETAFCNAVKSGAVIHGPLPPSGRGRCYVVNRPSPGEVMYSFSTTIQGNPVLGGAWFEESVGLYKIDLDFSTIREPGEVTDEAALEQIRVLKEVLVPKYGEPVERRVKGEDLPADKRRLVGDMFDGKEQLSLRWTVGDTEIYLSKGFIPTVIMFYTSTRLEKRLRSKGL